MMSFCGTMEFSIITPWWHVLALQRLFHFSASALFLFLSFFLNFVLWVLLLSGLEVNLLIFKKSIGGVPRFLSEVSKGELLQPYLVINVTGLVQFGKNLSYGRVSP